MPYAPMPPQNDSKEEKENKNPLIYDPSLILNHCPKPHASLSLCFPFPGLDAPFFINCSWRGIRFRLGPSLLESSCLQTGQFPRGTRRVPLSLSSARCSSPKRRVSVMHLWQKRWPSRVRVRFVIYKESLKG